MNTIPISVEWVASLDGSMMTLNTSGHSPAVLGTVYRQPSAADTHRWRWEACGSTWHAQTMGEAMGHVVKRLEMPSHKAWCDYAEETGIHPKP